MNYAKTAILLAGMTALFMGLGLLIGGEGGLVIAFFIALAMNFWAYWGSDKAVLRMYNAQEVDASSAPDLWHMTAEMAARAGIPMPRLYIIHDAQPNAFATGRNPANAAVAVNTGLMDMLTREEVAAVVAHELAHIKNRDTLIMTITATLAGAVSIIGNMAMFSGSNRNNGPIGTILGIAIMILAPIAAMVVQMAISRTREYAADKEGGEICGNPVWLASALDKISGGVAHIPNWHAERNPATAHMFIMNPLSGGRADGLFTTHPNPVNRIEALMAQAEAMGVRGYAPAPSSVPSGGPWGASSRPGPWG